MHFLSNLQLSLLFFNCCIGPLRETVNRLKGKKKKFSKGNVNAFGYVNLLLIIWGCLPLCYESCSILYYLSTVLHRDCK